MLRLGALRIRALRSTYALAVVDQASGRRVGEDYGDSEDNFLDAPLAMPPGRYDILFQPTQFSDFVPVAQNVEIEPGAIVEVTP